MSVILRKYDREKDYTEISRLLVGNYRPGNTDGNFLQPAWEYMHFHPMFDERSLEKFSVWEDEGKITAVVHYEMLPDEAFFQITPGYEYLKPEMLEHAEANLCRKTKEGKRSLNVFVNDFDSELEELVKSKGYHLVKDENRPMTMLNIEQPFNPDTPLPHGFRISSLAEDNDIAKIDRLMWRGFNHGDEPPEIDYTGRIKMQSGPNFRKSLNMIVIAPDGTYVSYAGIWLRPDNKYAYVEPVCTDPDYRRMGLARAALFEGIRRCGEQGAEVAYVGSILPLYRSMGFELLFTSNCWTKEFNEK